MRVQGWEMTETLKRYTVRRGHFGSDGKFIGEQFECDELPTRLYTDVYVSVTLNLSIPRELQV